MLNVARRTTKAEDTGDNLQDELTGGGVDVSASDD